MQLSARQADGHSLREHLQAAARAGDVDERLVAQPPAAGAQVWEAFAELSASRPAGMGLSAVPHSELEAWQRLHGVRLTPWEIETLMAMDRAALTALSAATPARKPMKRGAR